MLQQATSVSCNFDLNHIILLCIYYSTWIVIGLLRTRQKYADIQIRGF